MSFDRGYILVALEHDPNCEGCVWCRQPDVRSLKVDKMLHDVDDGLVRCEALLAKLKQQTERGDNESAV